MRIESTILEAQEEENFPCLRQNKDNEIVVYFTDLRKGMLVANPKNMLNLKIGSIQIDWVWAYDKTVWTAYKNPIEIKFVP